MNSVNSFVTRRGKKVVVLDNFKYSQFRTMVNGNVTYRCCNRSCNARLYMNPDATRVLFKRNDHIHDPLPDEDIEREKVRSVVKSKAKDNLFIKPNKLIRQELQSQETTNLDHADFKRLRESVYGARRGVLPVCPLTLEDCVSQLKEMKILVNGEQFCYVTPSGTPIFCTPANLRLLAQAEDAIADGTFSFVPKYFFQMYTVQVNANGFHIPVVWAFLTSKAKEAYVTFWMELKTLALTVIEQNLKFDVMHLDFEIAAHNAIRDTFPDCKIYGCTFHLHQAWLRRIKQDKTLWKSYVKKTETGMWLRKFMGLTYVPPQHVYSTFNTLMLNAPVEGLKFSYYIHTNYIEDGSSFPPSIWAAAPPDCFVRTTNGAESFHSDFNRQFYSTHPNIHMVISVLKEVQSESSLKITSASKGVIHFPRKETRDNLVLLHELWDKYMEEKDIEKYLSAVSTRAMKLKDLHEKEDEKEE